MGYIKREFLWYLRGNPEDLEICNHAKLWQSLISTVDNKNVILSNYGQYIFGNGDSENPTKSQFDHVISKLITDKDSRNT